MKWGNPNLSIHLRKNRSPSEFSKNFKNFEKKAG